MKKIVIILFFIFLLSASASASLVANDLSKKLAGKILLQVQSNGEAWYVYPNDLKKYYLGRPDDAFDLMKKLSFGITNNDLEKIPIGIIKTDGTTDGDDDGLSDSLEGAIGASPEKIDTDNDGFSDKEEVENGYNPTGAGELNIDYSFAKMNLGKIFLQVEKKGEAWYVNPADQKKYFLGRPTDAWDIMRSLSLGITNSDLNKITTSYRSFLPPTPAPAPPPSPAPDSDGSNVISSAASAIKSGNTNSALSHFVPELRKAIEYTMNFLNNEGKLTLGNILSDAKLISSTDAEKIYSTEVYFSLGGYKVPVKFYVKKQPDGTWLMANL